MSSSASRHAPPPGPAAARASWPGALMERVLRALAADCRRPAGPVITATVLAAVALLTFRPVPGLLFSGPALALAATAPVAVLRRFPATAIGVILGANAVYLIFGRLSWPPSAIVAALIAMAACPALLSRTAALRAFLLAEAAVLAAAQRFVPGNTPWDATLAEALAVVAAWGAGEMIRARRQSAASQAAAAEQVKVLSERDLLARERASVARELHDVVAHHVSMIAVRAGTAPYAISDLPEPGREAFAEIASQARTALAELRVVLGVLRDPARASDAAPQPRLADIAALLDRVRDTGTEVTHAVTGPPRELPASVELCGFRIVQEAVTNAGRHAPGSRVTVTVAYRAAALDVTVRNTAAPGGPAAPAEGTGFGLTGLRERVAMLGGEISAGPAADGGFEVRAVLPVTAGEQAAA